MESGGGRVVAAQGDRGRRAAPCAKLALEKSIFCCMQVVYSAIFLSFLFFSLDVCILTLTESAGLLL